MAEEPGPLRLRASRPVQMSAADDSRFRWAVEKAGICELIRNVIRHEVPCIIGETWQVLERNGMKRLGSAHHQSSVRPLTMLVEIGCSTGRSLVAHSAKDQRLLQMTDSSNSCNRRSVMAINNSTSLLRNSGRVRQATQTCATRFLPIRIRPITGAHSRLGAKTLVRCVRSETRR